MYYPETYTFTQFTLLYILIRHNRLLAHMYNGIRPPRLYIQCHTRRVLDRKIRYIIHKSMLYVCIHGCNHLRTYVYVLSIRFFNASKSLLIGCFRTFSQFISTDQNFIILRYQNYIETVILSSFPTNINFDHLFL
jgi:hypothetical protein